MSGTAPVLLLDEVVAHLDPERRSALFAEVERLAGQVWMTGADPAVFAEIEARAAIFEVSPGAARRRNFDPSADSESSL
jgi:DNA replication and repair protein RecF